MKGNRGTGGCKGKTATLPDLTGLADDQRAGSSSGCCKTALEDTCEVTWKDTRVGEAS